MNWIADYIVVLWLLPVTVFIIIPLLICFSWLTRRAVKDVLRGRIPFLTDYLQSYYTKEDGLQRRHERRFFLSDPVEVELFNDNGKFKGMLTNISSKGLCIEQLTDYLSAQYETFNVVLGRSVDQIVVEASSRWLRQHEDKQYVGLRLRTVNPEWENYCMGYVER